MELGRLVRGKMSEVADAVGNSEEAHGYSYHENVLNVGRHLVAGKGSLTRHMVFHTGARRFKCTVATSSVPTDQVITYHMMVHSIDRP